jgi:CDP-diacylglycerol--serine O-phosphatidyltransferase
MLKAYSGLGKQLDSLADLVSFGVAPGAVAAVLLRAGAERVQWRTGGVVGLLLVAVPLLIPLFSALRLARFNIEEHTESHFRGMPVPADAAAFAALGLMYGNGKFPLLESWLLHPLFILLLVVLNSWLMVSTAAMFSFKLKSYRPAGNAWRYIFAAAALVLVIVFGGTGLFAVFILYVLASLGMNIRIRIENRPSRKPGAGFPGCDSPARRD